MSKLYQVVCIDPPYGFSDQLSMSAVKRGASANYPTMSIADLKALPIKQISDPEGAILCLWVPSSLLQQGLDLMSAYGFTQKQSYIWVKVKKEPFKSLAKSTIKEIKKYAKNSNLQADLFSLIKNNINAFSLQTILGFNLGRLFRQTHEICLIGTNNNKIYQQLQNKSRRSVSFAPNLKHSAKPEHLQDSLEIMFPDAIKDGKCIELFARRQRSGWECIGNEINGLDIRKALVKLMEENS